MSDSFPWVAVLGGGLAGAIFNQLFQLGLTLYSAPRLELSFDEKTEGCVSVSRANDGSGKIVKEKKTLRLCVTNAGRSNAKNVQVMITAISGEDEGWSLDGEVIDLQWANASGQVKMDIPAKTNRFAGICSARFKANETQLILCGSNPEINTTWLTVNKKCKITFAVSAAAANAETVSTRIKLRFDGTADGLRIETT